MFISELISEKWSRKYKRSINCSNPRGFSQRAHCQGRKKNESQNAGMVIVRDGQSLKDHNKK
jgi:hypothetical protein